MDHHPLGVGARQDPRESQYVGNLHWGRGIMHIWKGWEEHCINGRDGGSVRGGDCMGWDCMGWDCNSIPLTRYGQSTHMRSTIPTFVSCFCLIFILSCSLHHRDSGSRHRPEQEPAQDHRCEARLQRWIVELGTRPPVSTTGSRPEGAAVVQ